MKIDFNKNWIFTSENGKSQSVNLPHDAMLFAKRYAACRSGVAGAYFSGGIYTYEKSFEVLEEWLGSYIGLLFEGVYRNATVYVNGQKAAFHANGFTEFEADITPYITAGENIVKVVADNSLVPNCRWYTGGGIYRPVWLVVGKSQQVYIKTLSVNPAVIEAEGVDTVEIYDDKELIYSGKSGNITINNAKLWSAETPYLYKLKCGEEEIKFGIRKVEWNTENGLTVNGNTVMLRGGCIHQDNGVLGACTYYDAEYRKIKILKEQGFNAVRVSHNPASRYLLQVCDELGMYVLDEAFDGWYIPKEYHDYSRDFWANYESDLRSMICKDYNHPSVIMYSIGNELTEAGQQKGIELAAKMRNMIREIDNTRPVTCGVNILINVYAAMGIGVYKDKGKYKCEPLPEDRSYKEKKSGSAFFNAVANKLPWLFRFMSKGKKAEKIVAEFAPSVDIAGYNYGSSRYDKDAKKYPQRLMLGTETMVCDLPYNWERVKKYPQILGDFVWSAWDYLGEACIGDWTYHSYKGLPLLAGQGMIDITGKPLASMAFMQVVWGMRKKPFIAVRPLNHADETPSTGSWQFTNAIDSWSWRGYEGKRAIVEVYSTGNYVELYVNDKKVGRKKLKNFKALFKTRYRNGKVEAISFGNGKELARHSLSTGGTQAKISVKCDKSSITDGQLVFAEIELTDENERLIPYIERRVDVRVDGGSIKLAGMGSALCKTDERFTQDHYTSYRGRCLAVFKGLKEGVSTITVSCANFVPATVQIEVS